MQTLVQAKAKAQTQPDTIPDYAQARRLLWFAVFLLMLAVVVGGTLDKLWHAVHVFDGFWSPPHLFVYAMAGLSTLVVLKMLLVRPVRAAFGRGLDLKLIPWLIPGPLVLLAGGLLLLGFAGIALDNFWHSNFGLDETNWSFPHALIGWSGLIIMLGVTACRLALQSYKPLRWYTVLGLGSLVILFSAVLMGPLGENHTVATVGAISRIPVLAAQPEAQHSFKIVSQWNLTRANPWFIPVAALWAGATLAFLRRLDRRWWLFLLIVLIWTILDNGENSVRFLSRYAPNLDEPANYLALPIFLPALLVVALPKLRLPQNMTWGLAGLTFGLLIYSIWDRQTPWAFWLTLLAGPVILLGKQLGELVYSIIAHPFSARAVTGLLLALACVPALTGLLDLFLRFNTPR